MAIFNTLPLAVPAVRCHHRHCTEAVPAVPGRFTLDQKRLPAVQRTPAGNACQQCSAPLPAHADDSHCGHCQKRPPAFDTTTALFHYRPPVDYLIKQLKFANELAIIPLLSALLSARLTTRAAPLPSLLIPVPLHQTRLRERGFNQATELARRVGRELGIRSDHRLCTRNRDTRPQSLLSPNARRLNLRNAFSVKHRQIAGHVAIIDDVMTTGQTSNELARVLKKAGAEQVEVWVIARAG